MDKKTLLDDDSIWVWECVLTDAEIAALAEGISPFLIQPDKLIYFRPLIHLGKEEN